MYLPLLQGLIVGYNFKQHLTPAPYPTLSLGFSAQCLDELISQLH